MVSSLRSLRHLPLGLVGITFLVLAGILVTLALGSIRLFEQTLVPELEAKSAAVSRSLGEPIRRAVEAGIPLQDLVGLESFFALGGQDQPEVRLVRLKTPAGETVYQQEYHLDGGPRAAPEPGDLLVENYPIESDKGVVASLDIGVDVAYVSQRLREIYGDLGITALVCLFLVFEVLLVVIALTVADPVRRLSTLMERGEAGGFSHTTPDESSDEIGRFVRAYNGMVERQHARFQRVMQSFDTLGSPGFEGLGDTVDSLRQHLGAEPGAPAVLREARPNHIRLPLFVFFFATELCRSFLPIFARDLYEPLPGLSYAVAIALPVAAYLFLVAVLTPLAGSLSDRYGNRRLFLMGLVPTAIGLGLTAFATDLIQLTIYRGINAVGFALTTIAALSYIARTTTSRTRAEGMAIYTAAFVTAGLCGTSIGAILAERVGYGPTFLIAAAIAVLSAGMVYLNLRQDAAPTGGRQALTLSDFGRVLTSGRFLLLILVAAIPTQMLTTGYLFYGTPMMLNTAGVSTSLIGQVMMVYFIVMIVLGVPIARLADRLNRHRLFAVSGLVLAGIASGLPYAVTDFDLTVVTAVSVGLVGVAHAMCISSQGAILLQEAEVIGGDRQTASISAYRVLERIGAVAGPIVVSWLAVRQGFAEAVLFIGAYVAVCGLLFAIVSLWRGGDGQTVAAGEA